MSSLSSNPQGPGRNLSSQEKRGIWWGILAGLLPLVFLGGIIIITIALAALITRLVAAAGFFMQQQAALIILIIGFVLAIGVYAIAIRRTLKQVKAWQQEGAVGLARSALWVLGITALVVALPLLLVIVLPQHPAP